MRGRVALNSGILFPYANLTRISSYHFHRCVIGERIGMTSAFNGGCGRILSAAPWRGRDTQASLPAANRAVLSWRAQRPFTEAAEERLKSQRSSSWAG
jgi:hypothetical protein